MQQSPLAFEGFAPSVSFFVVGAAVGPRFEAVSGRPLPSLLQPLSRLQAHPASCESRSQP